MKSVQAFRSALSALVLLGLCTPSAAQLRQGADPDGEPRLGIAVAAVPFERLEDLGLEYGVEVERVVEGSPADAAGVRAGDVIVELGGRAAYSPQRLRWLMRRSESPQSLKLELHRGGESRQVEIDATEPTRGRGPAPYAGKAVDQRAYLGIRMQELTAGLRESFGIDDERGVLIADVVNDGPAQRAGIRAGDVLIRMDRKAVEEPTDVYRAMAYFDPGERVEVAVVREGRERTLEVELGGVSPSRFHGGYPPQLPFPAWRDWSHPRADPHEPALPRPPTMHEMLEHWRQQWMREPQRPGGGRELPGRYL